MNKELYLMLGGMATILGLVAFVFSLFIVRFFIGEYLNIVIMISIVSGVLSYVCLLRVFNLPLQLFQKVEDKK